MKEHPGSSFHQQLCGQLPAALIWAPSAPELGQQNEAELVRGLNKPEPPQGQVTGRQQGCSDGLGRTISSPKHNQLWSKSPNPVLVL